jgi:hypothetical protein
MPHASAVCGWLLPLIGPESSVGRISRRFSASLNPLPTGSLLANPQAPAHDAGHNNYSFINLTEIGLQQETSWPI